jgi:hypothetical protein
MARSAIRKLKIKEIENDKYIIKRDCLITRV